MYAGFLFKKYAHMPHSICGKGRGSNKMGQALGNRRRKEKDDDEKAVATTAVGG